MIIQANFGAYYDTKIFCTAYNLNFVAMNVHYWLWIHIFSDFFDLWWYGLLFYQYLTLNDFHRSSLWSFQNSHYISRFCYLAFVITLSTIGIEVAIPLSLIILPSGVVFRIKRTGPRTEPRGMPNDYIFRLKVPLILVQLAFQFDSYVSNYFHTVLGSSKDVSSRRDK